MGKEIKKPTDYFLLGPIIYNFVIYHPQTENVQKYQKNDLELGFSIY